MGRVNRVSNAAKTCKLGEKVSNKQEIANQRGELPPCILRATSPGPHDPHDPRLRPVAAQNQEGKVTSKSKPTRTTNSILPRLPAITANQPSGMPPTYKRKGKVPFSQRHLASMEENEGNEEVFVQDFTKSHSPDRRFPTLAPPDETIRPTNDMY